MRGNNKYTILYHPLVVKRDIPKINGAWKKRIKKAIEEKLAAKPDLYGPPLRQSLKGYRKLRIGDYRVIYKIEEETVKIVIIGHRSNIYTKIGKRLKK